MTTISPVRGLTSEEIEERDCTCGAGHGSLEGHMSWCEWLDANAFVAGAASSVWPDFIAPPKYDNAAEGWTDPALPDFRLIWQVAHDHGYAVGLHGSMKRDCDLIAVAWVEAHATAEALIEALCSALNAHEVGPREPKPNGRIAVNLQIDGWFRLIDLSIVPAALASELEKP